MMATPVSACWKPANTAVCAPKASSSVYISWCLLGDYSDWCLHWEHDARYREDCSFLLPPPPYYWSIASWILIYQFLSVLFRSFMAIPHPETQAWIEGDGLEGSLSDRHCAALRLTLPLWPCSIVLQPTWCPSSLGMNSFPGRALVPHANSPMARPPCQSTLQTGLHHKILLKFEK